MQFVRPMCFWCKHYNKKEDDQTCKAFPGGIPEKIFFEGGNHHKPFNGDKGIRFEPKDEPYPYDSLLEDEEDEFDGDFENE